MPEPLPQPTVAVIGAGYMGHAIALGFALAGFRVGLHDRTAAILADAQRVVADDLALLVGLGAVDEAAVGPAQARIRPTTDLADAVAGADLVVEAVTEDLDVKRRLFAELDALCPPPVVLASNSSSFMPRLLAEAVARPDRLLVAHYFHPAHLIPLVEVVPGPATSERAVETAVSLLEQAGKLPVVIRQELPGFVGNRLQVALFREALAIVEAGIASPAEVDAVVTAGFGRRLGVAGPFTLMDMAGLDVNLRVMEELLPSIASGHDPSPRLREAVAAGRLGVKTGGGLLDWPPETAAAAKARLARALVQAASTRPDTARPTKASG
jgi:3-hydroxybutyryl-CoA dehydrogenase